MFKNTLQFIFFYYFSFVVDKEIPLVNDDYTINCLRFRCNKSNRLYTIVESSYGEKELANTLDSVIRDDDERVKVKRSTLKKRFTNIEPINIFYESEASKRSRVKRR